MALVAAATARGDDRPDAAERGAGDAPAAALTHGRPLSLKERLRRAVRTSHHAVSFVYTGEAASGARGPQSALTTTSLY
jgi:hypothetical protein